MSNDSIDRGNIVLMLIFGAYGGLHSSGPLHIIIDILLALNSVEC